jgi:hypothetical protein
MQGSSRRTAGDSGPSQLLAALAQCNDTVWVQHLLPKLRAHKSLSSAALSCKQLQALCHSNVTDLRLSRDNTVQQEQQGSLQQLPAHFPACSAVQYTADDGIGLGHFAELLPALARWVDQCCCLLSLTTCSSTLLHHTSAVYLDGSSSSFGQRHLRL